MKLLIHGDSNSSPTYVTNAQTWATLLGAALGFSTVQNLAIAGYYAQGVLNDLPAILAAQPDLCLVMVGTNDMAQAVSGDVCDAPRLAEYLGIMGAIIGGLKAGGIRVVIVSPVFSQQPRETARFPEWVRALRALCLQRSVPFVDLWSYMASLSASSTAAQWAAFFNTPGVDAYHLNATGHQMVANFLALEGQWAASPTGAPPPTQSTVQPGTYVDGTFNVASWSHTIADVVNRALRIATINIDGAISSVQVNGLAATLLGTVPSACDGGALKLWSALAPAVGSASIHIVASGCTYILGQSMLFSGARQDETQTVVVPLGNTGEFVGRAQSVTPAVAGSFVQLATYNAGSSAIADQNAFLRGLTALRTSLFDTNGGMPATAVSMSAKATDGVAHQWASIIATIAPAP